MLQGPIRAASSFSRGAPEERSGQDSQRPSPRGESGAPLFCSGRRRWVAGSDDYVREDSFADAPLFDPRISSNTPGSARRDDPDTSKEAGESAESFTGRERLAVLAAFLDAGKDGLTHQEAEACLCEWMPSGVRTRCKELVRLGLIVDTGRTRLTRSGRHAIVWVAKEAS